MLYDSFLSSVGEFRAFICMGVAILFMAYTVRGYGERRGTR